MIEVPPEKCLLELPTMSSTWFLCCKEGVLSRSLMLKKKAVAVRAKTEIKVTKVRCIEFELGIVCIMLAK